MTIDILPTIAELIGAKLPDHKIDGKNIWPLISGNPKSESPHEAYFFYYGNNLEAMRMGPWKLHFPHGYRSMNGKPGGKNGIPNPYMQKKIGLSLFNLDTDMGESVDVKEIYPEVVQKMQKLASNMRSDLGDGIKKIQGNGRRPAGKLRN